MLNKSKELNNMESKTNLSISELEQQVLEAQAKLLQEQYAREMITCKEYQIARDRIIKASRDFI